MNSTRVDQEEAAVSRILRWATALSDRLENARYGTQASHPESLAAYTERERSQLCLACHDWLRAYESTV